MPPIYSLLQALMDRQNSGQGIIPKPKPPKVPQSIVAPQPEKPMPQPTLPPTIPQPQGNGNLGAFLRQVGLPLGAAAIGSIFPSALPAASGFNTGFPTGFQKAEEMGLEREKLKVEKSEKAQKLEKDKWDDAYKTALELSKTGSLDSIAPMTITDLDALAGEVYKVRYGKTEDIAKKVEEKYIGSNKKGQGQVMTDANGNRALVYPDGTFEELK